MSTFDIGNLCGTQAYSGSLDGAAAFDLYCTLSGAEVTLESSLGGASNYSNVPSCSGDIL
ncbi:hypothetical protein [Microseira wollei]|uniref:Uncharacterized protein n=1 Tax=Microseira wollei NIES-4236 TaxID=2530354 RepID=A0AAV3X9L9_9CYAN|nr:hypothetical protein [Microseira wollei]GET37331.1 hypothetical protein MiSe_20840 [Microseira wollei NIES-4236]